MLDFIVFCKQDCESPGVLLVKVTDHQQQSPIVLARGNHVIEQASETCCQNIWCHQEGTGVCNCMLSPSACFAFVVPSHLTNEFIELNRSEALPANNTGHPQDRGGILSFHEGFGGNVRIEAWVRCSSCVEQG